MASIPDLRHAVSRPPHRVAGNAHAAVAAVFSPDLELLLMRRARRTGDPWSGHVSLPGGRVEPHDADEVAAAMRETHEEVGLDLRRHHLVGPLDDLAAIGGRPGMVIRPFVFLLEAPPAPLRLAPDEVADTRWVPLRWLLSGEGRSRFRFQRPGFDRELARITFPDGWHDTTLWGLTLRMIDDLMDRLDGRGTGLDRPTG